MIASLAALLLGGSAAATPKAEHHGHRISAASVVALPSAGQCVSRRRLMLQLRQVAHVRWISAIVKIDNKRFKAVAHVRTAKLVTLTGLPKRPFVLSIKITTSDRRTVTVTRAYRPCVVAKPITPSKPVSGQGSPATPTPTPAPSPAPRPTPPAPAPSSSTPVPGSYSGATSQGYGLSFFVSADSGHLLDVALPTVRLGCAPGGTPYDHLQIADIAIAADGSFTATTTQEGIFASSTAKFTYTFSGRLQGTTFSGTFREDLTYDDGAIHHCTSNDETWQATRSPQGTKTAPPIAQGNYSGATLQGYGVSLIVSDDSKHLQNISLPTVRLGCTPGGTPYDHLQIADIAIAPDGSFTATTTQDGVFAGATAHFTYTFSGHYHGTTTTGASVLAGQFREDITYNDGTAYTCTSDDQTWSATHT